ncbi:antitoxin Xre/MbcA/ParS toxin-binding domain-containing protein [Shewanella pneumatophori]|uniref:MbcA/ParS/Xre antitoxin family protein n=1 Tax=Shewanella pneumatophori TaxID=314092 RepID=A0A9X1ZKS3_9GAMM|nr:antitoxin Xre/MbcA/ParS toxin-binding domain-containing protein [Shewanella pneumatophori]MCL1137736.1 MbcA/ParS/Xre antitoxin family protein [Shewanella pneumatophori]
MKNPLLSEVKKDNEKLYAEIPVEVLEHLALKPGDFIEFGITTDVSIWKSHNIDVPREIFQPLIDMFKTEQNVFHWLNKGLPALSGKAPIEILSEPDGIEQILDLINRIKRGDFS